MREAYGLPRGWISGSVKECVPCAGDGAGGSIVLVRERHEVKGGEEINKGSSCVLENIYVHEQE